MPSGKYYNTITAGITSTNQNYLNNACNWNMYLRIKFSYSFIQDQETLQPNSLKVLKNIIGEKRKIKPTSIIHGSGKITNTKLISSIFVSNKKKSIMLKLI